MSRFSLAPYVLRIKQKDSSQYLQFGSIGSFDLLEVIHEYLLKVLPSLPIDSQTKEVIKISHLDKKDRIISGRFDAGENGYGSKLLDTETGSLSYERKPSEAELIPYYFIIKLPTKVDKGIVIFQRFKNYGIKDLFVDSFNQYFSNRFSNEYSLEIDPLVPKNLIKSYIQGRIVKIRLIKQGFPRDIFDVSSDGLPNDEDFDGNCELVLSSSRNGHLPTKIRSMLSKNIDKFLDSDDAAVGSLIEVKNFTFDNVKIQVRIGNSYRTVNFSDTNRLRYYEDVSGLEVDTNNHPKFDIIDTRAKAFLKDIAISIWGGDINV